MRLFSRSAPHTFTPPEGGAPLILKINDLDYHVWLKVEARVFRKSVGSLEEGWRTWNVVFDSLSMAKDRVAGGSVHFGPASSKRPGNTSYKFLPKTIENEMNTRFSRTKFKTKIFLAYTYTYVCCLFNCNEGLCKNYGIFPPYFGQASSEQLWKLEKSFHLLERL